MKYKGLSQSQKWILNGIPFLFIIGSLMHFLYDFCNHNKLVGLFVAVNESVWEHTKMVLLPVICWWSFYYILKANKQNIDKNRWFTSALIALITAIVLIPMLFYFYTESFGVEILVVDIGILFVALLLGQLLGFHFYKYGKGINSYISIFAFIILILIYIIFTISPPHIPIFKDSKTKTYGIVSASNYIK